MNRIAELRKEKIIDLLMRMADIFRASIDYIVRYSENRYPEYQLPVNSFLGSSKRIFLGYLGN